MLDNVYQTLIDSGDINDDPLQRQVLTHLQRLTDELEKPKHPWLAKLSNYRPKGVYMHGPVGVGKTYLMDLFYDELKIKGKARFHFHHFMQQVDKHLRRLQGHSDPLKMIARHFARKHQVLCFDEFLVHDVAYAMILAALLQALFREGVVLVATSNSKPDDLYLHGVQRPRFLPAIGLIKTHCEVLSLGVQKDYRLGREPLLAAYLTPLNEATNALMNQQFTSITSFFETNTAISIQNREIACLHTADKIIWFDFKIICNLPRSQLDYLEIADKFDTVFISDIPALTESDTIYVILLVHLVDVFYDRGIRLILSAAVPVLELYVKGEMQSEFKRTASRLQEMQSADYLRRHTRRRISGI